MITNDGKELIGKYLLGQAPAYATHISIGCGARPLAPADVDTEIELTNLKNSIIDKSVMDFEMIRVPITSKGFVDDNGVTKLCFSAELPGENRYDISEVALWSAGRNNLATNSDSRIIFNFSEQWEKHDTSISTIPFLSTIGSSGDITVSDDIFSVSTNDITLRNSSRRARKEGPRYLNTKILVRGDTSSITGSSGSWSATGTHIHLNGINFSIGSNSPSDKLKLALSLINKTSLATEGIPDSVKILIEFYRNEVTTTRGFARAEITIPGSDFTGNSYKVVEIPISDLITSPDFSSSEIRLCRIFVDVNDADGDPSNYYIALDGLRLDNLTTENPLYKMVGYSIVNVDGTPIIKFQNTNNHIEFRMSLGLT